jgi:ectoine hydroxylase-related dioxygenase (phytanoyl-CoA dioxygenase family)
MPSSIVHLPASTSAEELHEHLITDGAVIVDELVDQATVDAVRHELAPFIETTPFGSDDFAGVHTRRTGGLIARSPASHALIRHPLILHTTAALLAKASNFQLHLTQAIALGPDQPAQPIHRDQWAFDFFPFPADYHVQCNTIWALTEFTEANGATRVIPGSQDWPDSLGHTIDESVPAEMSAGSCLLYTGKVYHGGGANATDAVRMAANITYVVGWLRQEENQYLSVPHDVAAKLDDHFLRLIGYARGAYALGYIDDVRDPLEAVRGRTGTMSLGTFDEEHYRRAT